MEQDGALSGYEHAASTGVSVDFWRAEDGRFEPAAGADEEAPISSPQS